MSDDLAQVLDHVQEFAVRFIAYPTNEIAPVHALWIAHAHVVDAFENTPRLSFLSPEPGSGKSRAMEITEALVPRAVLTVNASVAYVFRKISDPNGLPTLLMDEADAVFSPKKAEGNEDLRGLLNSGYRKGATAGRVVTRGGEQIPEDWPSFCPVALAGLGNLPDTLMTRSIVVPMKKRRPDQILQPYRRRRYAAEAQELRDRLARVTARVFDEVRDAWPVLPEGIEDRDADIWEPLIAIADAAGSHWPRTARDAATTLVKAAKAKPVTLGVRLLEDVRTVFENRDAMTTVDLLSALRAMETAPWAAIKGEPLDSRTFAQMVSKYEVPTNNTIRIGGTTAKGYRRSHFADAWSRYLAPLSPETGDNGNDGHRAGQDGISAASNQAADTYAPVFLDQAGRGYLPKAGGVTEGTAVTEFPRTGGACRHDTASNASCQQCLAEAQGAA
ncbi:DUF3631 domain-containing protein [Kocuria sp. CPCC 205263]|uniref:DUF3631 domain-containing protein n=1 Tax=Kocuria sp. CPCC 205263 TaxID=3073555 RepID=UPI0034D71948